MSSQSFLRFFLAVSMLVPVAAFAGDDQDTSKTTDPKAQTQTQPPAQTKDAKTDSQGLASTPPVELPTDVKHSGGKDDVDAIGNRNVGKRGLGNWYSIEREISIGKQYSAQVESTVKLVQDPVVNEYVNRIGQNLVRNSDAQVPFTIKVVDSDDINAFALPGGYFYVNSGLILAADDESELAGVMAHEIAHVCARHAMRQATKMNWANLATIPLIFVGGGAGLAAREAASFALPLSFLKFSRGDEAEADYLGLQYMYKTGYDPQSFIAFFEKLKAQEKKKPGFLAKAFDTHPQTPDRIEKSQAEIAHLLPPRQQYIEDTSEFEDVKARLANIENRHKIQNPQDNRPTLRRANGPKDQKDDGRPTLKKRGDS